MYHNFLAPVFDYSDIAFRLLCQKYGADATCIPLVNALALVHNKHNPKKLASIFPDSNEKERNLGVQFVSSDAKTIAQASQLILDSKPYVKWLNINCGCPSSRTMGCGGGSSLLDKPEIIATIVSEMKNNTSLPVSVKMRINKDPNQTIALCKQIQDAGADFLIVHGRTPNQAYSGKCDWDIIKLIKENISIPVVGNGDISSESHGSKLVNGGYCDSFMICRAAMSNPMVFCNKIPKSLSERVNLLREYISFYEKYFGDSKLSDLRPKAINFMNSLRGARELRGKISQVKTIEELSELLDCV
ncbi:tRNA-dihydrouridine synthase family protein [Candidatus Micrarchaeota archaeon]|nr:tRNA-dihydrouridine synthase family protein [Candidatus Micrarchaeota archaeon]MBU1165310.1 tRNA-dihydrouridine synthase family protein [Candidatus Micrarchaeota archaeon]MBU1886134.1 tRNA-dihydrouridine synthase family protein [Candidatus Micrarchaeota archaeon]